MKVDNTKQLMQEIQEAISKFFKNEGDFFTAMTALETHKFFLSKYMMFPTDDKKDVKKEENILTTLS